MPLAAALQGKIPSYFATRDGDNTNVSGDANSPINRSARVSAETAKLIVIGSSEMSDKGAPFPFHMSFLQNLIDWSLEDTALLSIRSAGAFAKTLRETEPDERQRLEWLNYFVVFLVLFAVWVDLYPSKFG